MTRATSRLTSTWTRSTHVSVAYDDILFGVDLDLLLQSDEAAEGINAFTTKRTPDFGQFQ